MLKLRLSMGGTKKRPVYKIVVADSRFPRDGRFIEKLGYFNPLLPKDKKDRVGLESERIKYWLSQGAKPTTRVARILGENKLIEMPAAGNNPNKAIPKKDRKKQDAGAEKKEDKKADAPKAEEKKADAPKEAPKAQVKIFTLYPDFFPGILSKGIYGRAIEKSLWNLDVINIRDYAKDKHKTVDDTPYGGGEGMVLKPDVVAKALDQNLKKNEKIIYLTPKGKTFDQNKAKKFLNEKKINILCGHFEGIDQRVIESRGIEEISIGDYILSGGETAAYVILDSILRLVPGVLGNENTYKDESFENGLLEYPQYTKPQIWEKTPVPEVLLSGDHSKIKDWRLSQSEAITRHRRPDLWQKYKKN